MKAHRQCVCVRWFSDPLKWWGSLLLAAGAETAVRCRMAVIRYVLRSLWSVCGCERLCVNVSVFSSISHTVLIPMPCTSVCPPTHVCRQMSCMAGFPLHASPSPSLLSLLLFLPIRLHYYTPVMYYGNVLEDRAVVLFSKAQQHT